ncbi:hypothetical protein S40293_02195 [Stachybotrys chartarum IBT 40293]|nr:hypothetical protein S40293_02195 [Stachybotrys chartarum IBT 40293]
MDDSSDAGQPGGKPEDLIKALRKLNSYRALLGGVPRAGDATYKGAARTSENCMKPLDEQKKKCDTEVAKLSPPNVRKAARPAFHQQRDPTARGWGRIWGWVLVNYANPGHPALHPERHLLREVRLAGPENAQRNTGTSPASTLGFTARRRWGLPRRLLANDLATDAMQPAPDAYAAFDNTALLGRPLALVHAGWSLELAADQLVTQASNDEAGSYTAIEGYLMMVGKYKGDEVK